MGTLLPVDGQKRVLQPRLHGNAVFRGLITEEAQDGPALPLPLAEEELTGNQGRACGDLEELSLKGGADPSGAVAAVEPVVPEHDDLSGDGLDVGDDVGGKDYDSVRR